jgi:hypothetical protein
MKIKWLVVLFIFFLGVILLSLLIVQESQKAVFVSENRNLITEQVESNIALTYPPQVRLASIAALPAVNSGISIIKSLAIDPEETSISASKIADKAANNVSSRNVVSGSQVQDIPSDGTTEIRKQPPSKVAQEMNSSGIVMY